MKKRDQRQRKLKTETVSDVIARTSGKDVASYDPALSEMFTSKYKIESKPVAVAPVSKANISPKQGKVIQPPNRSNRKVTKHKSKKDKPLPNDIAAELRIKAKQKSGSSHAIEIDHTAKLAKINLKHRKRKAIESDVGASNTGNVDKISSNQDVLVKKRKKRKEVEVSNTKTVDSDESDGEDFPSKATEHNSENKSNSELNTPKPKDAELEARTVFIGNVPKDVKKKKLKQILRTCGHVESVRLRGVAPSNPSQLKKIALRKNEMHPDSTSITAYARFQSRDEAKDASTKLNGYVLDGNILTIDLADNRERDNKKAVFIGNLHLQIQENELRQLFSQCGLIHSVRVVRDAATRLGKGFGYVNFKDAEAVVEALKLDGTILKSRPIRVKRAVKKEKVKGQGERQRGILTAATPGRSKVQNSARAQPKPKRGKSDTFSGDHLAEVGKLKRKTKKPNKLELKRSRIAKQLATPQKPVQH